MVRPLLRLALLSASLTFAGGLHLKLTHVDAKEGCTDVERMRRTAELTHRRLASSTPARLAENQYSVEYLVGDPPQKAEAIVATTKMVCRGR
ncbi:aspartic proteinase nepenthesin-1-like [Panicum miliaceum]|uniref:Aspartic proteinase nepenthesin-1-like n=1 Tax=Panicum miliaceum TaxID=4540 RepID=A0A3L6SXB0_PANMI|nr:aspartic proteinase nepenthesin-1-like [Panicum miliaceum]